MTPAVREAWARGRALLDDLRPTGDLVAGLAERLADTEGLPGPEDAFAWLSCVLGLVSANEGNYGVGAVVLRDGEIVAEGRNRLLQPRRDTSAHAESDALDTFEARFPDSDPGSGSGVGVGVGTTLYTSLECCPMCTVRLLNSGIRAVRYLAPDEDGGMLSRMAGLPPYWRRLAAGRTPRQTFEPAACHPVLGEIAADVFATTEAWLNERLVRS
ncbi:nucleoside deaminase [Actinokineospora auranticolor]|uniref:Cytosine deaminase n=1 Tax=Actinokineospora auranticolor TaxID=155976 RepID=A0A2S6GJ04_9PSEU|nr:nucleoside deaminase [Actinokineospora auranticolor]PPK65218.1 cytosine deaminase [Actinokineospora auranticolor]